MTRRALVTGGTGFVGSHVVAELVDHGVDVTLLKRKSSKTWRLDGYLERMHIVDLDDLLLDDLFREQFDAVVHLATYYRKGHSYNDISPMIESNITLPAQLLELAANHGVPLFINTGSFSEYSLSGYPLSETSPRSAVNMYSATKLAFEHILEFQAKLKKIKALTLILFSPYGEKDNEEKLIPMVLRNTFLSREVPLSHGNQKLDFTYVGDIARAYSLFLDRMDKDDWQYEAVNLGTGVSSSIRDVVKMIEGIVGTRIDCRWGQKGSDNHPDVKADIHKADQMTGWKPEVDLSSGLGLTAEYYRKRVENAN